MPTDDHLFERLLALCVDHPRSKTWLKTHTVDSVRYIVGRINNSKDQSIGYELLNSLNLKSPHTRCIIMTQLHGHKLLRHYRKLSLPVIFCRLWRWPDLKSQHNLAILDTCHNQKYALSTMSPYHPQRQCINPYHYAIVKPTPKKLCPLSMIPPDISSSSFDESDPRPGTKALPGPQAFQVNHINDIIRDILTLNPDGPIYY